MSHSAEFLRGAVKVLEELGDAYPVSLMAYRSLLAETEAREAAPNAAEVIAQCRAALELGQLAFPHANQSVGHSDGCICVRCENQRFAVIRAAALAAIDEWEVGRGK